MAREVGGSFDAPEGGTVPLNPIPDRAEPINFPYRGSNTHGVEVEARPWIPQDADEQSWTGEAPYDATPYPLIPVPVEIVNRSAGEIREWRTVLSSASKLSSNRIAGANPRRTRMRIKHVNTADATAIVFIGHDGAMSNLSAWPLSPGESVEITTEGEVWALLNSAATNPTADVAIILEMTVGGN